MTREHIGHIRPRNNAVRRDASPVECSGAFYHGLLLSQVRRLDLPVARWQRSGHLTEHLAHAELVRGMALEDFVATANKSTL